MFRAVGWLAYNMFINRGFGGYFEGHYFGRWKWYASLTYDEGDIEATTSGL
jgi:hypothetical protein